MPRKKKKGVGVLPSGQVRLKVFDYAEPVFDDEGKPVIDPKTGKQKIHKVYQSITADDIDEARILKAKFIREKKTGKRLEELTVGQAIDKYIAMSGPALSPTTIQRYEQVRKYAFQDIMDVQLRKLTPTMLKASVAAEIKRPSSRTKKQISAKTVHDEFGVLTAMLNLYYPDFNYSVTLPQVVKNQHELSDPETIFRLVQGKDIELAVLLAMWLSFTMSEIKGLTKSKSISKDGTMISIVETNVMVKNKPVTKDTAKQPHRRRHLRIPDYIRSLIDQVDGDVLVPQTHRYVSAKFIKMIDNAGLPHMTFHDLRHVNASVMAFLGEDKVPAQYARARGGWSSDHVMRGTYMQLYDRKRTEVDNQIDEYFQSALNLSEEKLDPAAVFMQLRSLPEEEYLVCLNDLAEIHPDIIRSLDHMMKSS